MNLSKLKTIFDDWKREIFSSSFQTHAYQEFNWKFMELFSGRWDEAEQIPQSSSCFFSRLNLSEFKLRIRWFKLSFLMKDSGSGVKKLLNSWTSYLFLGWRVILRLGGDAEEVDSELNLAKNFMWLCVIEFEATGSSRWSLELLKQLMSRYTHHPPFPYS
jgi:hypothetical protein